MLDRLGAEEFGQLDTTEQQAVDELRDQLTPRLSRLHLTVTAPDDARGSITLDGVALASGQFPLELNTVVDPGEHQLHVTGQDLRPHTRSINLSPGQLVDLSVHMTPSIDTRPGTLTLTSSDPSARLEILGVAEGPSPLTRELEILGSTKSLSRATMVSEAQRSRSLLDA